MFKLYTLCLIYIHAVLCQRELKLCTSKILKTKPHLQSNMVRVVKIVFHDCSVDPIIASCAPASCTFSTPKSMDDDFAAFDGQGFDDILYLYISGVKFVTFKGKCTGTIHGKSSLSGVDTGFSKGVCVVRKSE